MGETSKFIMNALAVVVIGLAIVRILFMETMVVPDNGMAPTLVYGEEVLVWRGAKADMADVMVCVHPARPTQLVVGRAVVFAGHSVWTDRNGMLYVDNDRTTTGVDGSVSFYDEVRRDESQMLVGSINYFGIHDHQTFLKVRDVFRMQRYEVERGIYLLGDNRSENSFDSREFGEVDPAQCIGQIVLRWRPMAAAKATLGHDALELIR